MFSNAEKNILNTIAYYDELNYPLTAFEIWKYLTTIEYPAESGPRLGGGESNTNIQTYEKISLSEIIKLLDNEGLKKCIEEFMGFYFLKGRKGLIGKRLEKNKIASFKLKKLRKIVWFLRFVPFIRMIAVTGRLAMKNTDKNSDWDLFVALKKGKIWTGRTIFTAFAHIIGKRRYGNKIKDRICLNYFITDESLKINISSRPLEVNLFSANEYSFMIPVFGFKIFRKFQIRNLWIKEFKPNFEISEVRNMKMINDSQISKIIRKCGEKILKFDFIEKFLRKIEMEKIANNPKTHFSGSIIEANENALVFLPEPQGKEIHDRCQEKLAVLGVYS